MKGIEKKTFEPSKIRITVRFGGLSYEFDPVFRDEAFRAFEEPESKWTTIAMEPVGVRAEERNDG